MSEVVYVATWENVQNYPDGLWYTDEYSGLINTFQAVLITDFINTFMIYNYIDIQFSGRDSALVGYTTGDGVQFFNQPGSLTNAIRNVSQVKTGNYTGMLFFHLASASIVQATADSQCQKWYCEDKTHRFRDPSLWSSLLAPCPWTASHAAMDSRYIQVSSSSDKGICYIQAFPYREYINDMTITPETVCCYENETGLIKLGSPNGGSCSPYHRFSPVSHHQEYRFMWTVQPFIWCCIQSNNCHLYFERRPSRSTDSYNRVGWG